MGWTWYLFRFNGRIGRAEFWCSLIYFFCGLFLVLLVGAVVMVLFTRSPSLTLDANDVFKLVDPATYHALPFDNLPVIAIQIAGSALLLWVYLAITVKRLHDRDRSAWWLLAFFVLPGLYTQFEDRLPDSIWMLPVVLASTILYCWGFIETGFRRGTDGPNRFGPDPMAEVEGDPSRAARTWDQHSALEFVPTRASPPGGMHVKRDA